MGDGRGGGAGFAGDGSGFGAGGAGDLLLSSDIIIPPGDNMFLRRWFSQRSKPAEPVAKRLVLAELRSTLSAQYSNADGLDSKLKQLLSSASLILSIVTTLQITTGIKQVGLPYLIGLAVALLLYAILITFIMRALRPMTYYAPIPPKWDDIAKHYFGKDEDTALSQLISTYLDALEKNDAPLTYKTRMVNFASVLLVLIVIVLLLMGVVGLGGNTLVSLVHQSPLAITPMP